MSTPPPHSEVKELALQLLVSTHAAWNTDLLPGARAVERAKEAYALAQVYLGTLDDLEPRDRPPRPRPPPTS